MITLDPQQLEKLRDELTIDEGFRLVAYRDSEDLWTIGRGHLLGPRQRMIEITRREAEALFAVDVEDAIKVADRVIPTWRQLDLVRQRVILNMAFNLGNRLEPFVGFRAAIAAGDWVKAAEEMMDSKWALQVKDRAKRLRDKILKGVG